MKCPGQDTRYWKPGDIFEVACPRCGRPVEFFKDESTRRCRGCGTTVVNPRMDFGCAAYCGYAAECLGEMGPELLARREDLFKDRVAVEVKRRLGKDFRSIAHAVKVARLAEVRAGQEKAQLAVVLCAAFLHVFSELPGGGPEGEREAREVLERLGAAPELALKVMEILEAFSKERQTGSAEMKAFLEAHTAARAEDTREAEAGKGERR